MRQSFEELIELIRKSLKYDPWTKKRGLKGYCVELRTEADEAIEAVEKEDYDNLKEELGDVLLDWGHACMIAENENLFTTKDVIETVKAKLAWRKPYLNEGRTVTKDEAHRIWTKAKEEEKTRRR